MKKEELKFSVLISLYDNESEVNLNAALKSLREQTLQPSEIVMVFDGHIRNSLREVVESHRDFFKSFIIVKIDYNVGLGRALNYGLKSCKFDYIARMDTDDICYPERFEKQMIYLAKHPKISVLGCAIQEFDKIPNDLKTYRKLPLKLEDIKTFAKFRNPLNHPSVIFKKSDVLAVGSYMHMPLFEDYYLWVRMLDRGFIIENLSDTLLHFRIGNDMIGRRHGIPYLRKELNFLNTIRKIKFITNINYAASLVAKMPLRVIPKRLLKVIYKRILR